jgi:hypothetical protein
MTLHELRLLDIETARVRHAWAKAQIEVSGATPALTKYLGESLNELDVLKANERGNVLDDLLRLAASLARKP